MLGPLVSGPQGLVFSHQLAQLLALLLGELWFPRVSCNSTSGTKWVNRDRIQSQQYSSLQALACSVPRPPLHYFVQSLHVHLHDSDGLPFATVNVRSLPGGIGREHLRHFRLGPAGLTRIVTIYSSNSNTMEIVVGVVLGFEWSWNNGGTLLCILQYKY